MARWPLRLGVIIFISVFLIMMLALLLNQTDISFDNKPTLQNPSSSLDSLFNSSVVSPVNVPAPLLKTVNNVTTLTISLPKWFTVSDPMAPTRLLHFALSLQRRYILARIMAQRLQGEPNQIVNRTRQIYNSWMESDISLFSMNVTSENSKEWIWQTLYQSVSLYSHFGNKLQDWTTLLVNETLASYLLLDQKCAESDCWNNLMHLVITKRQGSDKLVLDEIEKAAAFLQTRISQFQSKLHELTLSNSTENPLLLHVKTAADAFEQNFDVSHDLNLDNGHLETVLRRSDRLVDAQNNQFTLSRPNDTTIQYEDGQFLIDLLLIWMTVHVLALLAEALRLPRFLGQISAGVLLGPAGLNWIQSLMQLGTLMQLGVILLLFELGRGFSWHKIKSVWQMTLTGGVLIMICHTLIVFFWVMAKWPLGAELNGTEAIYVAVSSSCSSTFVAWQLLGSTATESKRNRIALGLLVIQDVVLCALLALLSAQKDTTGSWQVTTLKLVSSLLGTGLLSRCVLPIGLFLWNSSNKSEMLCGLYLAWCFGVAYSLDVFAGLSMELGAFLAGVLITSAEANCTGLKFAHIQEVRHRLDQFTGHWTPLFMAGIGLHVVPSFWFSTAMPYLLLATIVMVLIKFSITFLVLRWLQQSIADAAFVALSLAHVSEFALVVMGRAKAMGIVRREAYYVVSGGTVLSMLLVMAVWRLTNREEQMVLVVDSKNDHEMLLVPPSPLEAHPHPANQRIRSS